MLYVCSFFSFYGPIYIFFFFLGCDSCVGQNVRHECADAGDCKDNICYCDVGFTGKGCQIGRK